MIINWRDIVICINFDSTLISRVNEKLFKTVALNMDIDLKDFQSKVVDKGKDL